MTRKPTVVLTRRIHEDAMEELGRSCPVVLPGPGARGDRPTTRRDLLARVRQADALITMLTDLVDETVLQAGRRLKIVANAAVGTDNIHLQTARARGIVVTNTPGVLTEAVADLAWALILAVRRRIVEADRYLRQCRLTWSGWAPGLFLGHEVHGKTLGIIGCGRIGQAVAHRARGFSMPVLYTQRTRLPVSDEWALGATYVSISTLLARSDVVTLHTPLTPETRHLIGRSELSSMKSTACLINTARGPVVDEQALIRALRHGVIAGAGLDVYEAEPAIPPALRRLPNVVLLPHIGSASVETRRAIALAAVRNVLAVLAGKSPPNPV